VKIAVIGVGSMGSAVADMAARYGVEEMVLVDPDKLEPENLKRHVLTDQCIGWMKVDAMLYYLQGVNHALKVKPLHRKFDFLPEKPDVIACCADSDACCQLVNQYCLENKIPCVWGGVHGAAETAEVITYVPGFPCYACYEREGELPEPSQEKYTNPNYDPTQTPHQEGLWCDVLVAASMTFRAILDALEGKPNPLILASLRPPYGAEIIRQKPGCAVCSNDFGDLTV
jgi:molybdopterin/thiamine biosynthesis adenylyltransferase